MIIYGILGCIIIGLIIAIIIIAKKKSEVKAVELQLLLQEKQSAERTIENLKLDIKNLENRDKILHENLYSLQGEVSKKEERNKLLTKQEQEVQQKIINLQNTANTVYDTALKTAQDKFDIQIEQLSTSYQKEEESYKQNYLQALAEWAEDYDIKTTEYRNDLLKLGTTLEVMKQNLKAAIEDQKRKDSEKMQQQFYQVQISELDLKEVKKIRDILPYMRNERPLCKAIWESYYRTPCNDLIARIINKQNGQTGIYKITNQLDSKVYIGQAVNLTDRIRTHIKAGLGIDTPNSILYKAMRHDGVENFSFEIMEYCSQQELNEKEKFWIDYFFSQDWGYNMTSGGAAAR